MKASLQIEMVILLAIYSILSLMFLYLYGYYSSYKNNVISWNNNIYIKNLIEKSDKVVCFKDWKNPTNVKWENELCDKFNNTSQISNYLITLTNVREKKFYKTLYIWEENLKSKFIGKYIVTYNQDLNSINPQEGISKNIFNTIEKVDIINSQEGFSNWIIYFKGASFPLYIFVIDKNFLE